MGTLFIKVVEISVVASFLMLAVILIRLLLRKAPKWFMGVLWTIVALRLIFPFQIESSVGFLPDVGSRIEEFFYYATGAGSVAEVTYHNYEPNTTDTVAHEFTPSDNLPTEDIISAETDFLPNEQIIVTTKQGSIFDSSLWRRDLFVRLQMIWLFGLLIILTYAVFSYIAIYKKTRASIRLDGVGDVYVCDEIDSPFILGVFKPAIYLPTGLDDETTRNVLAHEKAHMKRLDYLRKQFGFLILAVYWFNPLVWVSYALFCKDIELACDEKVISHMSLDEKKSYANSLLLCSTHKRLVLAYPLAFGEVGVGTRVKHIFNYREPTFWLIVMLVVVCAGLSTSFLTSASKEKRESEISTGVDSEIVMTKDRFVEKWCDDFKDRNAQGIINASTEEVQNILVEEGLLEVDGDSATFGWASPWPGMNPDANHSCAFTYTDDEHTEAEIFYSAIDTEPHVYLWKEIIKIDKDNNGEYKVVSEEFIRYENIETADDYDGVWNASSMLADALDYTQNGLGEALNNNAKSSSGDEYKKLFEPLTAARYLLNLSEDESEVTVLGVESPELGSFVAIHFKDSEYGNSVDMVQPWGPDGIYVPARYLKIDNSTDTNEDEETTHIYEGEQNNLEGLPNSQGNEGNWVDLQK